MTVPECLSVRPLLSILLAVVPQHATPKCASNSDNDRGDAGLEIPNKAHITLYPESAVLEHRSRPYSPPRHLPSIEIHS